MRDGVLRDLIVFGEDWGAHPSSTQHLIRHLAPGRRVVWVNSIGLRRPKLSVADLGRVATKLKRAVAGGGAPEATREPAPFPLVNALAIPMAEGALGRAANRWLIGRAVRAAAAAAGLRRPVVWASLPSAVQALGALGESAVVYYCCDDFGALAGVDHVPALRMEEELAGRADLILASSPLLAAKFDTARTHLLPHGVDYDRFATPVPRAADMPEGGPVAGFYGTLAPWLDLGLVAEVARRLPQWRFVLIGHPATDLSPLQGLANVVLLGPRPHAALPSYSQHWTAGIIPFVDNAQIRASNPLKLREYLAAGRPVVSTPFPALQPYMALVAEVEGPAAFAAALEAALADPPGAAAMRQAAVAAESWAARAADAAVLIDALP
ncbi:glycosyltransferase [Dankookia sp. GCM10030260]|uniref:glycosyltransferase n=1 Tax=Dankookia sp. GCM10030260 TaxID=3273390 RepID=UPI00360A4ADB